VGTKELGEYLTGRCSLSCTALSMSKGVTNHAKYPVPELVEGEKGRVGEGASATLYVI